MLRYEKLGFSIVVGLPAENYLVRADILKTEENKYEVTLELRLRDVPHWDMMNEEVFKMTSETINSDVCALIERKYNDGYFRKQIERYDYELKCFDLGNEIMNQNS